MEIVRYKLPKRDSPLPIIALGDIQWTGDPKDIAINRLKQTVKKAVEDDGIFVGMGDYIDYASPSNRASIKTSKLYDNARAAQERLAHGLVNELYNEVLALTRGRWVGLLEGHHFYEYQDGTTSDQELAELLSTQHLGWTAFIRIEVQGWKPVVIWASHGSGSGQTAGSQINKIDRVSQWAEADVYLLGHWSKLASVPISRIVPNFGRKKLEHKTMYLVGTGGYLRGYMEGRREGRVPRGTYVETGLLRPTILGSPRIWLTKEGITVEV